MSTPSLIAVDWGTTNFRAYLAGADGKVFAQRESPKGILSVENGAFAGVLRGEVTAWIRAHGTLPVMMSGMIGSRQGWVEAPYVRCPAGVRSIAAELTEFEVEGIGTVHLVPGLDHVPPGEPPDVMRGEEAQIVGAIAALTAREATFVHPGTHSKWVAVSGGAITGFTTYMTGEVYGALRGHTILGRLMRDGAPAGGGFLQGVEAARRGGPAGRLLHQLFSVRTLGLFELLPADELPEYLSGLLIGAEIAASARAGETITIFGSDELTMRYGKAAEALGVAWNRGPSDSVVAGHLLIARAAGLLGAAP
ncbi:MAG: 2-dehydro-3-deoxygalactonokinase [Hyphomicrobiaceae bacterium]|nr:2-dehydro-3-deoxygalactonokinase [Hyphomicrobiaceae bacterium]